SLPHSAAGQYDVTTHISMAEIQPGDLLFYYSLGHVTIYVGGGMMVEAPHTGTNVQETPVRLDGLVGAGRPG
ncbi:MAG: C40 family peptidase, partial [Acidimicrobiia bacterium]|nr:C40 family peptidase [Acidimicrobiia bacterium]